MSVQWKWSTPGEEHKLVKSFRTKRSSDTVTTDTQVQTQKNINNDWKEVIVPDDLLSTSQMRNHNNAEISDNRALISHRGTNPFLSQNNYVNDVGARDLFMKPINTSSFKKQ